MNKGVILFICALFITVLSIINLSIGPIVSGKVGMSALDENGELFETSWGIQNCQNHIDGYDIELEKNPNMNYKTRKYTHEYRINRCKRTKAMYNMEYTSFIFDIFIGSFFVILGLFLIFEVKPDYTPKIGLIGLISGIVGFILTLVYVVYNGIVYTNYYETKIYKRDSDGAFAIHDGGNDFKCIYYEENQNVYALIAKFSDLNQNQYNYDKKLVHQKITIPTACKTSPSGCISGYGYISISPTPNCDKLYVDENAKTDDSNKDISNRFLTALILSLFVCIAHIGLALFGFLLFIGPSEFTKIENSKV